MSLTVCKIKPDGTYKNLYEFINTYEEAELLAQLAMSNKSLNDLIFIFPGYNRGIERNKEEFEKALKLATKYKAEERTK